MSLQQGQGGECYRPYVRFVVNLPAAFFKSRDFWFIGRRHAAGKLREYLKFNVFKLLVFY